MSRIGEKRMIGNQLLFNEHIWQLALLSNYYVVEINSSALCVLTHLILKHPHEVSMDSPFLKIRKLSPYNVNEIPLHYTIDITSKW